MRRTCLLVSVSGTYLYHANTGSVGQMSNLNFFEAAEAIMCASLALYSAIYSEHRCLDVALSRVSERVGELGAGRSMLQLWMARVCQALTFQVRGALAGCDEARGQVQRSICSLIQDAIPNIMIVLGLSQ